MGITYIRHVQHQASDTDPLLPELGITESGVREAEIIRSSLPPIDIFNEIRTFPHQRAMGTLAVVTAGDEEERRISRVEADPRLSVDPLLDYLNPGEDEFGQRLFEAYMSDRNFEFLVHESDRYAAGGLDISNYSRMAGYIATGILQAHEALRIDNTTLVCAREFFLPSLRAKLIELNSGSRAMLAYVEWYTNTQEAKDLARLTISSVNFEDRAIILTDAFGTTTHGVEEFESVSGQDRG